MNEQVNEAAMKEAFGLEDNPEETPNETPGEQLTDENLEPSPEERPSDGPSFEEMNDPNSDYWKEQAKAQGWREDYTPDNGQYQKTAREFVQDGKFMDQTHRLRQDFDRFKSDQEKSNEANLELQRVSYEARLQELTKERTEAVETADTERFNEVDKQIQTLQMNAPQQPAEQPPQPVIKTSETVQAYQAQNPWLNDVLNPLAENFQKASYAHRVYNQALAQNKTPDEALEALKAGVREHFPDTNPRRNTAPGIETGTGKPKVKNDLSFNQLSGAEQNQINNMVAAGLFDSIEEGVKAANKARGELNG